MGRLEFQHAITQINNKITFVDHEFKNSIPPAMDQKIGSLDGKKADLEFVEDELSKKCSIELFNNLLDRMNNFEELLAQKKLKNKGGRNSPSKSLLMKDDPSSPDSIKKIPYAGNNSDNDEKSDSPNEESDDSDV